MKTKTSFSLKPSLLILPLSLFTALGAAGAITSIYYTSGSGAPIPGGATLGGTLASVGFDAYQTNNEDGNINDGGLVAASLNGFGQMFYQNYTAGLPATLGDGSTLNSITIILFAEEVSPIGIPGLYNVLDGLGGNGALITSFSLTRPADNGTWVSLTLTATQFAGGFSIAAADTNTVDVFANFASEENSVAGHTPLIVANYVSTVPEPSVALLGALGALGLLLRRRI